MSSDCTDVLDQIKTRKQRYVFFKISDDSKKIEVEHEDSEHSTFGEELENLVDLKATPEDAEKVSEKVLQSISDRVKKDELSPRYIYFNYVCDKSGRTIDKMVLFL